MTDNILAAQAEQRTRALREVALFRSLTDREIALAVEVIEVVSFQRGDYVVRRGEMGSGFFSGGRGGVCGGSGQRDRPRPRRRGVLRGESLMAWRATGGKRQSNLRRTHVLSHCADTVQGFDERADQRAAQSELF